MSIEFMIWVVDANPLGVSVLDLLGVGVAQGAVKLGSELLCACCAEHVGAGHCKLAHITNNILYARLIEDVFDEVSLPAGRVRRMFV